MPVEQVEVEAMLFDMDGTLISSTAPLSAVWVEFAAQYNMDLDDLLKNSHGKRTVDNLEERLPHLTHEQALAEAERFEARIITLSDENREKATSEITPENPQGTIVALPGVKELLTQINEGKDEHPERRESWAICTSATGDYARKAFMSTRAVPELPAVFVSANDVSKGKPDPEPYLKGAEFTHSDIKNCIVIEDAPAGVLAGKRAGAKVLGLKTTHDGQRMWDNGADWLVQDLSKVSARWENNKLIITIDSEEKPSA
ncbi:hypothetical protein MCUN1_001088 [Malassezia cuniculi]|uniref:Uncharacterized protein n=1 Tax=Malassezia cuniculi TaxID=948313 RepID=A0AAF0EPL5_9BASI|nr:hypothetical protein MCUN1_001088 [Malassezia cuniculi]